MKKTVSTLGSRAIDRRTTVGRALAGWRHDLILDLGGPDQLSTQQEALVDLIVREKLMLDSIDAYLLDLGGAIINRKKRSLLPVIRERAQLADSFTRRLMAIGIERRVPDAPDLSRYLADRYGAGNRNASAVETVEEHPSAEASSPTEPEPSCDGGSA